ncbi:MAG: hypothetical protein GOMPHAMPRED_002208 [Gomphillus americanus]|uniref:C3H1-type domain-containing protein n=1 Tax=Gomphillus americanus TaxID=1940652 RepID=A0A8H3FAZ6_9LECA|nr:MAG: hypothetical protein GOMPHAMPRED_002208 [Gomphillus americanus]
MANSFTFPPPPPPPPSAASSYYSTGSNYHSQPSQQSQRGRDEFNSNFSRGGRGRADYGGTRGNRSGPQSGYSYQQRNGFSRQNHSNGQQAYSQPYRQQQFVPTGHNRPLVNGQSQSIHTNQTKPANNYGYKRTHDQAFPHKATAPKIQTAPSVPSFGFLPSLAPQRTTDTPKVKSTVPVKRNLLGLIPVEDEEDDTDVDEESKLAAAAYGGSGVALSFEVKGELVALRTSEDIAAWIAERRRNFPTAARGKALAKKKAEEQAKAAELKEAARKKALELKKMAEEKAKAAELIEAARKKAIESRKDKRTKPEGKQTKTDKQQAAQSNRRAKPRNKSDRDKKETKTPEPPESAPPLSKEQLKIEKLRRAMEKNAKKLAKLVAASEGGSKTSPSTKLAHVDIKIKSTGNFLENLVISDASVTSSDETSSSDFSSSDESDISSNSDSDLNDSAEESMDSEVDKADEEYHSDSDAPQELSSSRTGPIRVPPPPRGREDNRALCRNLKNYGRCQRKGCRFRHKPKGTESRTKKSFKKSEQKPAGRLSLYQRLLKQQIEAEEQAQLKSDKTAVTEQDPAATAGV